jgi:hypothetical protein
MIEVTDNAVADVAVVEQTAPRRQLLESHLRFDSPQSVQVVDVVDASQFIEDAAPISVTILHSRLLSTMTHSLAHAFLDFLPAGSRVERVYYSPDKDFLRVWTIIPEPDLAIEEPIYDAQLRFMDKFPEYACDFSVIYRLGKPVEDVSPQGFSRIL